MVDPIRITTSDYVKNRTNHIRIQKDAAEKIITRYLRQKIKNSAEAIELANRICDGLISNMPEPGRTGLRSARIIQEHPPEEACRRIAAAVRAVNARPEHHDQTLARAVWEVVYKHAQALPDDVVA